MAPISPEAEDDRIQEGMSPSSFTLGEPVRLANELGPDDLSMRSR